MEDYQLYRSDKQQEELRLLMRKVLRSPAYTNEEADQAVVGFRLLFMILLVAGLEEDCLTPALQVPQTSLENLNDLLPITCTSHFSKESVNPENDGHENKQIQRRADHWLFEASRSRYADQRDWPQTRLQ